MGNDETHSASFGRFGCAGERGCGPTPDAADSRIVGKSIVTVLVPSADSQKDFKKLIAVGNLTTGYDRDDAVNAAIRRRALATDDTTGDMEVEFRPDGTSLFSDGSESEEGTWTYNGDRFTQSYRGKMGKPAGLAWDGTDRFYLNRSDGPPLAFLRKK